MDNLVNSKEIAEMFGVKKSAVSMWKVRYDNFPKPITHGLYDRIEIVNWYEFRRKAYA